MRANANIRCVSCSTPFATWCARAVRGGACPTICRPGPRATSNGPAGATPGGFEALTDDLRQVLRLNEVRAAEPSVVIFDSRALQSTPKSGHRAGYDGVKRRKGSKVHVAVDTPANEQDRAQVGLLAAEVQAASCQSVTLAYADQGYTGEALAQAAEQHGIDLQVVKLGHAKRGFVLLPRRWVVERSLSWSARYKRLARGFERLAVSLQQLHYLAFVGLMLTKAATLNLLPGS